MDKHIAQPNRLLARRAPLDDIDNAILSHLQQDGRRSLVIIARALSMPERTVRARVQILLESGVVRIVALTSPKALGYNAAAMVGMENDPAIPASQIAASLAEIDDVDYVANTTGRFRIFAEIISVDMTRLQAVIEQKIATIPGILRLEIFPYYSVYFQKAQFFVPAGGTRSGQGVRDEVLDQTDQDIVAVLRDNARMPLRNVSEALGISESQIRMRLAAMQRNGQLNITAILNPMNLKDYTLAWLAINVSQGASLVALAEALSQQHVITYVAICGGRYDIFAEIVCPPHRQLLTAVESDIRSLPGVGKIETFMYLDLHYNQIFPMPPRTADQA